MAPDKCGSVLLVTLSIFMTLCDVADGDVTVKEHWNGGFLADVTLTAPADLHGWRFHLVFDSPVTHVSVWDANIDQTLNGGRELILSNKNYNRDLKQGETITMEIDVQSHGSNPPHGTVYFDGYSPSGSHSQATHAPTHAPTIASGHTSGPNTHGGQTSSSPYSNLLGMSILFYEAQRSGKLPPDNRIPWRGDSALGDRGDNGEDLTGGWYDAGDHVKFNFPLGASVTWLAWGLVQWPDAYRAAGQLDHMYSCIQWPLDYLLKCWQPNRQELYVQVGDAEKDHSVWGRAEDMTMPRPALKVTASKPGSDVAGQTAAALAAGAVAFRGRDSAYSNQLLAAARGVYSFAKAHRGKYSDTFPDIKEYYASSGDKDDLALAAAWLHKATGEATYLTDAQNLLSHDVAWGLDWDDKTVAVQLLLLEATGDAGYRRDVQGFLQAWLPGGSVPYTPCGLAFRDKWGPNSYAANAVMVALLAADQGIMASQARGWARGQIEYMIGQNSHHQSYVVGYGSKYPQRVHHADSSCPSPPAACDWSNFESSAPNHHLLQGALVGGPDAHDNYADNRSDYIQNEVACDYNAGFQSALAGLVHLEITNGLPAPTGLKC